MSCNHVQFAMRVLFCLFVCFGGQVTVMDMGGQIILLVYTGWTQSVRSHFPIDHNSVSLTQARPKYWPNVHNQTRRPRERYLRSDNKKE